MGGSAMCGFSPEVRKQGVVGRSFWGLQVEAVDPFLGRRGTALALGSLPLSAVGGTRDRAHRLGRHLCVEDRWGTPGERRAGSLSAAGAVFLFSVL